MTGDGSSFSRYSYSISHLLFGSCRCVVFNPVFTASLTLTWFIVCVSFRTFNSYPFDVRRQYSCHHTFVTNEVTVSNSDSCRGDAVVQVRYGQSTTLCLYGARVTLRDRSFVPFLRCFGQEWTVIWLPATDCNCLYSVSHRIVRVVVSSFGMSCNKRFVSFRSDSCQAYFCSFLITFLTIFFSINRFLYLLHKHITLYLPCWQVLQSVLNECFPAFERLLNPHLEVRQQRPCP